MTVMRAVSTLAVATLLAAAGMGEAQDLEPRVYLASPVGGNLVVVGATLSFGDVVVDPTAPVDDARARVGAIVAGYYRAFPLFGRSASLGGMFPLARGSAEGFVAGQPGRRDLLGAGDAQARLTVNLVGSPAMDVPTYAKRGRRTNLGVSLIGTLPVGQYDQNRAINLGTNRWSVKPEVGLSVPVGKRWLLDTYVGTWFFADNAEYVFGVREQAPLLTTQFHVSYNLSLLSWAAFDATFYAGGRVLVDGTQASDRQSNTRLGATLSVPITKRQSLKFAYSTGAWVRTGSDFRTLSAVWNYAWIHGF